MPSGIMLRAQLVYTYYHKSIHRRREGECKYSVVAFPLVQGSSCAILSTNNSYLPTNNYHYNAQLATVG